VTLENLPLLIPKNYVSRHSIQISEFLGFTFWGYTQYDKMTEMMRSIRRVLKKCGLDAVRKNLGRLVGKLNNLDPKVYPRVKSKFEATQTSLRGVGVTQQRREDATVTTFKTSRKDGINKWKTYYSTAATSPKNVYPNAEAEKSLILAENKDRVGVYC